MSHHKRTKSSRRTYRSHQDAWIQASSTISDILGQAEEPEHYFQEEAAELTNLGLEEFVGASRRGINTQGYINLRDFYESIGLSLAAICEEWCNEAALYMKNTHPWQNQTGNAERGLGAVVAGMDSDILRMYLYHSVFYGKYLEGANGFRYPSGRIYPVIQPTLDALLPDLKNKLQEGLMR